MISTESTETLLKENKTWSYVRTDRNNTRYFSDCRCGRCGGRGGWEGWPEFTCYECCGSGKTDKPSIVKIYTPEHAAKLAKQREARAKKAEAEHVAKAIAEREQNLIKAGFGKDGDTFVIYRVVGNTFEIKDELKKLGCKFKPQVGWYSPVTYEGYPWQRLTERDVLKESVFIEWKDKDEVEPLWTERQRVEESPSKWVGNIGERIDIHVKIDRAFESEFQRNSGWYGTTTSYMYLMHDEAGNVYKWSTSCYYKEKDECHFKATVKDHADYKGIKQTVLTRCTLVKE